MNKDWGGLVGRIFNMHAYWRGKKKKNFSVHSHTHHIEVELERNMFYNIGVQKKIFFLLELDLYECGIKTPLPPLLEGKYGVNVQVCPFPS